MRFVVVVFGGVGRVRVRFLAGMGGREGGREKGRNVRDSRGV